MTVGTSQGRWFTFARSQVLPECGPVYRLKEFLTFWGQMCACALVCAWRVFRCVLCVRALNPSAQGSAS